ncbi:MAG: site-2 protease family protein [ANME-2 cluster archaeon]|nr:site-2 protease family protein [ANME-2 cluster archaeon]
MKWSVQIGKVIGIPIQLHITFLFILLLFIYYFSSFEFQIGTLVLGFYGMDISLMEKLVFSTIASILFFSTILLHEISHSFVAKRNGLDIKSITLFVFGGVAQMEEIPRDPKLELKMAAAGPGISLVIGIVTYAFYMYYGPADMGEMGMNAKNAVLITAGIISFYNLVLGIFNLLPAFPMDGGRVLRAFLALWLPYMDATRMAVSIGKTFAFLMGIFGLLTINIILVLIALFVYYGAQGEERETFFAISLEGIKVKDVMTHAPDLIYIPPDWTISQLVDVMFRFKHMGYPVQEDLDKPPMGVVTFEDVQKVSMELHNTVHVRDIMTKDIISVRPEHEAYHALQTIAKNNIGRLLVIQDSRIKGIVTMKDIMRNMQFKHMNIPQNNHKR